MAKGSLAKTDDFSRVDAVFEKVHLCLGSLSLKWDLHTFQTHRNVGRETLWRTHVKASPSDKGRVEDERSVPLGTIISNLPTELLEPGYIVIAQKALGSGCAFPSTVWHLHWHRRSCSPAAAWEAAQQHLLISERDDSAWRGTAHSQRSDVAARWDGAVEQQEQHLSEPQGSWLLGWAWSESQREPSRCVRGLLKTQVVRESLLLMKMLAG